MPAILCPPKQKMAAIFAGHNGSTIFYPGEQNMAGQMS